MNTIDFETLEKLAEWKQAASVEAGLRREFHDRAQAAETLLKAIVESPTIKSLCGWYPEIEAARKLLSALDRQPPTP